MWPWVSYLTSPCLNVLICKRGVIIALSSSNCWKNWVILSGQSECSLAASFCFYYKSLPVLFTPHRAARVIILRWSLHIFISLNENFPWLPVIYWIKSKLLLTVSWSLHHLTPAEGYTWLALLLPIHSTWQLGFLLPRSFWAPSISRLCSKRCIYLKNPFHTTSAS